MIKYILKRIGLSVIILLGVSLIIYFLVRLMPQNYLETKFSSQIQQGTITKDQLNDFKKKYGLYMPDAYLEIDIPFAVGDVVSSGTTFRADTTESDWTELQNENYYHVQIYSKIYACLAEDMEHIYLELTQDKDTGSSTVLLTGSFRVLDKEDPNAPKVLQRGLYSADENGIRFKMTDGTDETVPVTYKVASFGDKAGAIFSGYFTWLGNMLKGDMGDSFLYQKPVATVIAENMWISFAISFVALILQFAIAIPMGITSATHQYSVRDYTVTVVTMIGISLPSFFFAALLIKIFSSWLGILPASGLVSGGSSAVGMANLMDMLWHLILPMTVLVVLSIGGLMRYTRTNMLEVLNSDYIRTARSKGLSEKKVIYVHAFRNTMIPLMTLLAGILPSLFGGAMITEEVFSIDGIGRLAYKALQQGDIPFIMGYNMFLAVLTVIGTLFSDLMYAVVDPRVKLSK